MATAIESLASVTRVNKVHEGHPHIDLIKSKEFITQYSTDVVTGMMLLR